MAPFFALPLCCCCCCGFFFPASEAFDRHSRAGALTPVDRSCLRYIRRVMADIKFPSKQQRTLFESLWIERRREARGGSCRRLQKLAALLFGTAGFQLLVQAVISTPSIQCQNVLYVRCLSVLPALRQSSYPFFFSVFFLFNFFFYAMLLLLLSLSVHLSSICSHVSSVPHCVIVSSCKSTIYEQQSLSLRRCHSVRVKEKSRLSSFGHTLSLQRTRFIY